MDIHIRAFTPNALLEGNLAQLHLGVRKASLDGLPGWVKSDNNITIHDVFCWYHDLSSNWEKEDQSAKNKYGSNTPSVMVAAGPIPDVVAVLEHSGRFTYVPDEPEIRASISESMLAYLNQCNLFSPHIKKFACWARTFPGGAWRQNYEPPKSSTSYTENAKQAMNV